MNANILLINADAVGTETLKNLVLPGVGRFTVIDDKQVTQLDLGTNFFVDPSNIDKMRADVVKDMLCEMNPDVTGLAITKSISFVLQTDPSFLSSFNLVITANIDENLLAYISSYCSSQKIPLIVTRAYGLIGYLRLQLHGHSIIESKPDSKSFDLRISNSFKEFEEYCDGFDFETSDSLSHSHIPYPVILYRAISKWRAENGGAMPSNKASKDAFEVLIKSMSLDITKEINFEEAVKHKAMAFTISTVPGIVQELLQEASEQPLSKDDSEFDILLKSLIIFMKNFNGCVPLNGQVPDMTATSASYVQIQKVFHDKAVGDMHALKEIISSVLTEIGRSPTEISDETIELFCHNVYNLRRVTTTKIEEELSVSNMEVLKEALDDPYDDPLQTPIVWYLCLRAVDRFQQKHGRWPGTQLNSIDSDANEVWANIQVLCKENETDDILPYLCQDHAIEITKYAGYELHSIAAMIGGVAAQEAVKVITHQYVPLNNTYVYNGIAGVGGSYTL
jgi:amyloid beta precursor protein binding protein 1